MRIHARSSNAAGILLGSLLVACGDATGPTEGVTVSGLVLDEVLQPQAHRSVIILGHRLVRTDAEGAFVVEGVEPPYDLVVDLPGEPARLVYMGLTRTDPTIVVPLDHQSLDEHGGKVTGAVTGGVGVPVPADHRTAVFFESAYTTAAAPAVAGEYQVQSTWYGPSYISDAVLHALQWQFDPETGLPIRYEAYGRRATNLLTNSVTINADVEMDTPVQTSSITGSVSVPAGYGIEAKKLLLHLSPDATWELVSDTSPANTFDLALPSIENTSVSVVVRAEAAAGDAWREVWRTGIGTGATDIAFEARPAPILFAPEDGHGEVTHETEFIWTPTDDAVYLFTLVYADPLVREPTPPALYIYTTRNTLTLPDLEPYDIRLQPGAQYQWRVYDFTPFGSVDELAEPSWLEAAGDHSRGASGTRMIHWQ